MNTMTLRKMIGTAGSVLLAAALLVVLTVSALYAGSVTTKVDRLSPSVRRVAVSWSGTSDSGTVADPGFAGMVLYAEVVPSGSPTADYDITITNATGIDLFGGQLNNLSSSASERREPVVPYVYWSGAHTFTWANQSEASASGTVYIYIRTP